MSVFPHPLPDKCDRQPGAQSALTSDWLFAPRHRLFRIGGCRYKCLDLVFIWLVRFSFSDDPGFDARFSRSRCGAK